MRVDSPLGNADRRLTADPSFYYCASHYSGHRHRHHYAYLVTETDHET